MAGFFLSKYKNYTESAKDYDKFRVPVGIEIIIGYLTMNKKPLDQQVILDAGCGTGNYLAALKGRVGRLYGIEANSGMLEQAARKLQDDPTVQINGGTITQLPYEDDFFDGILCNQVIHHLDKERNFSEGSNEDTNLDNPPNLAKFINEAFRILRKSGVLIINTCSYRQIREGYWYAEFIPAAIERMIRKYPSIPTMTQVLLKAGFQKIDIKVPFRDTIQGPNYFDPEGPLKPKWRASDSTWALVTDAELTHTLARIRQMNEDGSIHRYIAQHEQLREKVGQTTFIYAKKV
jgi:ubiquinone/menaquinone biosynthesis C-methylase UbiE